MHQIMTIKDIKVGDNCVFCDRDFDNDPMMIIYQDTPETTVFIHLICWLPYNYSTNYTGVNKMSDKNEAPFITPLGDVKSKNAPWDYTHSELVDNLIVVYGVEPIETAYGNALLADISVQDERVKALIGAKVLVQKLNDASHAFPVSATIVKRGKYYDFA